MAKMLSVEVDESYAKAIDRLISSSKLYSSRSEFLKDSIRKNLVEMFRVNKDLKKIHFESEKLAANAMKNGFNGKKISNTERELLAKEFLKEKGLG